METREEELYNKHETTEDLLLLVSKAYTRRSVSAEISVFSFILAIKDVEFQAVLEAKNAEQVFPRETQVLHPQTEQGQCRFADLRIGA